jgi:antitoxin component YwqK of YwqJK toxin-antitoxin module
LKNAEPLNATALCFFYTFTKSVKMKTRLAIFVILFAVAGAASYAQTNVTDATGKKQGTWTKKYPNGNILYQGTFKDDKPIGEFKRFYDDGTLKSLLVYDADGNTAIAIFYHPDGKKAAEGKYISQKKEGTWKYYSATTADYMISEENYTADKREGLSRKFYNTGAVAEVLTYHGDLKEGEWIQYYTDGTVCLKATYSKGLLEGAFVLYFPGGVLEFEGTYVADKRNGKWKAYNEDGSLRSEMEYIGGKTSDPSVAENETKYLDDLEKNKGKILDPEMTGDEKR